MQYHIDAGARTKQYIAALLPSMLAQLKLDSSRTHLHIIVDRDIEHTGQTIPLTGINTILVVLKPVRNKLELGITLAHELAHVAQFAKGLLVCTPKGKRWKGRYYGRSVAYLDQPWEQAAFARQEIIFRRAIE